MKEQSLTSSRGFSLDKTELLNFKILAIWIVCTVFAFLTSWFLKSAIDTKEGNFYLLSAAASLLFLVFFILENIFINNKEKAAFVIFIQSLAFCLIFIKSKSTVPILVLTFLIFWVLFYGSYRGGKILNNSIKFSFSDFSRAVLPKAILALSLFFSVIIPISLKSGNNNGFPLPNSFFEGIIKSSQGIAGKILPGVDLTSSIGTAASQIAETNINKIPEAKVLPPKMKMQLINKAAEDFYGQISDFLGIKIDPSLTFSQTIYQATKEKFFTLSDGMKNWVFIIIGALLFLSIEGVSLPIRWIISLIGFIVYEIMLATGFARISVENTLKEVIIVD